MARSCEAITTINSYERATPLAGTGQAYSAVTVDNSANANYAYDGLLTTALKAGSNAYIKTMADRRRRYRYGHSTASGRGSVSEIDTMFQTMWDTYRTQPTVLYVNSQELKNITTKVLSNSLRAAAAVLRASWPGKRSRLPDHRIGRRRVLLQPVRDRRRPAHPHPHPPTRPARHDHRMGRKLADPVPK